MKNLKILNLYAGIGGNAHNWDRNKHDITHVEINEQVAEELERLHPEDEVIVGDAHEYLKENYSDYDFIWASPPCQTHSQLHKCSVKSEIKQNKHREAEYPDMKLYQEIILLEHFFEGDWVVENVNPYYKKDMEFEKSDCLIKPQECDRHLIWSNFDIPNIKVPRGFDLTKGGAKSREKLEDWLGIELSKNIYIKESHDPGQVLRNAVHPKMGEEILKSRNKKQTTLNSL